jgi:ATP-dependent NAD(P)H-hydrate dehydratase
MSKQLNNTTIVKKGLIDIISNGDTTALVGTQGGLKRCGGQGDLLCGMLGTFCTYKEEGKKILDLEEAILACMVTREASRIAFFEKGHCLVTPDIIQHGIPKVIRPAFVGNL